MSGMPEIGSKISLISKADIRYEGKLFTVNPTECTIALATVRSYGTEDREVENPVPPQPQTYDFILFRGSDIKDIRVVNQLPNDPAIVQMTVPPNMGTSYGNQTESFNPLLGQMGSSMANQYPNIYNPISSMAPGMGRTIIKPMQPQQQQQQQPPPQSQPQKFIGGSRSSTPGLLNSRKSPTIDQGVQVSAPKVSFGGHPKDDKSQNRTNQNLYQRDGNRNRGGGAVGDRQPYNDGYRGGNDYRQQRRDTYSLNHIRPGGMQQHQQHPVGSQGQQQQMRVQGNQGSGQGRGGWINRGGGGGGGGGGGARGRGRGRSQGQQNFNRAPGQQIQQQQQQQQSSNNSQKNKTLKFEGDYDFDKANTEFEELRSQLAKVKIAEAGAEPAVKVNGEDKKDDSGNETGIGEGEQEEEEQTVYYDKAKSFFDNISCEAVERSKGRSQRTDWRTERKLNSETFGVASARRGGFRGRGGYYSGGRGLYRGGGGGGNYRGNYNRGQGNRQRNTNSMNSNNRPHMPTAAGMLNQNNNG